ncbi:hypothetical protein BJY00DRAFT_77750 [Aspergillus carlsbadensis]|nr:hypothetical protein BJY00DRAFT_77750 [Aspergillus carlsbadensis]
MTSIESHHYGHRHHHHPYYTHHNHHADDYNLNPAPKPSPKPSNPTKRTHPRPRPHTTNASTPHQTPNRPPSKKDNNTKRCFTWLLTPSGTMHWAKNRSSFRTYQRAPTKIAGTRVLGVGTVELKVRRGPSPDEDRMNTLVLRDVLHVPGARCNGICLGRYCRTTGDKVEVENGKGVEESGHVEEVRVFSEGESSGGSASEGEGEEDHVHGDANGHHHKHGEALWYGEGYYGRSRVVLWGDPHGSEDLDNVEGNVDVPGVDASAEELDTLFTRVKERSLV